MATGQGICCTIKSHDKIEGADFIVASVIYGQTVILNKESNPIGTRGILFDIESELSDIVCKNLNLYRHENLNDDKTKKGYIEDSRRIRPLKLKSKKCDGLFLSFNQLESIKEFIGISKLKDGIQLNEYNKIEICKKYMRPIKQGGGQNKQIKRVQKLVYFAEHLETDQLLRNLGKINIGDKLIISRKIHGMSWRVGYLPILNTKWYSKILKKLGIEVKNKYALVAGSRHVLKYIKGDNVDKKDSFYKDDLWTEIANKYFDGKLIKGETLYGECCGFLPSGGTIMPSHNNEKLKNFLDKEEYKQFIEKFGKETIFNYGCQPNEYKIFIYRITLSNEDGVAIDLSWEQVKRRAEELGVNHVPELESPYITDQEFLGHLRNEEQWINITEKGDPNFPQHLSEGICVRTESGSLKPTILKNKNFCFKVLENIIKDTSLEADIEESN